MNHRSYNENIIHFDKFDIKDLCEYDTLLIKHNICEIYQKMLKEMLENNDTKN